jgi:AcrR family transcriptional regulator
VDRVGKRLTREQSRQRTRELLLDAAAKVFAQRGYHAASVEEIAEEVGFTKGAVYANYPTKERLFLAVIDRQQQRQAQTFQAMAEPGRQADDAMGQLSQVAAPTDSQAQQWGLLTLEFFLYAVRDPALREELAQRFRTTRKELAASLEPHMNPVAEPALSSVDAAILAMAVSTGLGVQAVLEPAAIPADLYQRMMSRLLQ